MVVPCNSDGTAYTFWFVAQSILMRNSTQWISMWKLRKLTILNFSLNIHWMDTFHINQIILSHLNRNSKIQVFCKEPSTKLSSNCIFWILVTIFCTNQFRLQCFQPQENLKHGFKKRLFQLPCVFILFSNSYHFIGIRIQPNLWYGYPCKLYGSGGSGFTTLV